jgi:hypothetical protein
MSTLRTDTILDSLGGNTTTINGILVNSGALEPDDRIINGDFGVWQRANSSTGAGYVAADRWFNGFVGGTVTQSRQPLSLGDNLGTIGLNPTYFLRQTVSGQTLPAQYATTLQRIEGVRSYAGQTITVLGWARRSSGNGNMCIEGLQSFGSGGGGSLEVYFSPTTVTLSDTWAPFAAVMSVPSIFGKTLGVNGNDHLGIQYLTSAGANYNARTNSLGLQTIGVDLWGIHIKRGIHTVDVVDLYRPRDPGTELALCQRYYESFTTGFMGWAAGAGVVTGTYSKFYPKRANPIATNISVTESVNLSTAAMNIFGNNNFRYYGTSAAAGNMYATAAWAFDAEL